MGRVIVEDDNVRVRVGNFGVRIEWVGYEDIFGFIVSIIVGDIGFLEGLIWDRRFVFRKCFRGGGFLFSGFLILVIV